MISYLSGTIVLKAYTFIILDVRGVGYKMFVSSRTLQTLPEVGKEYKLFCHLHVREDAMELYGFLSHEELELFEIIDAVSGVGPKAALQIASVGSFEEFRKAIAERDEKFFAGIHGIGKKKIQKIILELTGKFEEFDFADRPEKEGDREAVNALVNLGFSRQKAKEALSEVSVEFKTAEERIREALKIVKR